jgi:hypothetical protein
MSKRRCPNGTKRNGAEKLGKPRKGPENQETPPGGNEEGTAGNQTEPDGTANLLIGAVCRPPAICDADPVSDIPRLGPPPARRRRRQASPAAPNGRTLCTCQTTPPVPGRAGRNMPRAQPQRRVSPDGSLDYYITCAWAKVKRRSKYFLSLRPRSFGRHVGGPRVAYSRPCPLCAHEGLPWSGYAVSCLLQSRHHKRHALPVDFERQVNIGHPRPAARPRPIRRLPNQAAPDGIVVNVPGLFLNVPGATQVTVIASAGLPEVVVVRGPSQPVGRQICSPPREWREG